MEQVQTPQRRVLIVDDEAGVRESLRMVLKNTYEAVAVSSAPEAVSQLAAGSVDVVLLDIVMPNRNGYDILRSLKKDERTRHTPVVLVTSKNQESDRIWGKRQGADEYVMKPFTPEQLLTVVRRFVK